MSQVNSCPVSYVTSGKFGNLITVDKMIWNVLIYMDRSVEYGRFVGIIADMSWIPVEL